MTDFFSAARFSWLMKAHWAESRQAYLWFVCVAVIIDLILLFIAFSTSNPQLNTFQTQSQPGWYATGLFSSGVIFAGLHFRHLAEPGPALVALMRPGSTFEKWMLALLVTGLLFPLVYTGIYCLLHFPAVEVAKVLYVAPDKCTKNCTADFRFFLPFLTPDILSDNQYHRILPMLKMQLFTLMVFWIVQALVLCGSAFFRQSASLRTLLILFLLLIVMMMSKVPEPPVIQFWGATVDSAVLYTPQEVILSFVFWIGLLLLLWLGLYFHLKERELM